ncbi:MAG: hypothetical protein RJA50_196, partial [Actinomycetota bacterium]
MNLLKTDSDVVFQLVVTGSHLSERHGETVNEIEGDGFTPDAKLTVDLSNDSRVAVAVAMANTTAQMAETFSRLAPDLIVVLGDRYEILATAQAALILGIPVAHIHGGEVTTGAFDDSIRHAITKISNLHFVAADEYARRVIQLGEQPNTVFNVGSLGVEIALSEQLLTQQELSATLNLDLTNPILLVTHHPTTNSTDSTTSEIAELFAALKSFSFCTIIFTGANPSESLEHVHDPSYADTARKIIEEWDVASTPGEQPLVLTPPVLKTYAVPVGTADATAKAITERYPWIRVTAIVASNQIMVVGGADDHGKVSNVLTGGMPVGGDNGTVT